VILIGEMRDTETIDTALKAAETGHLVISTLHTQNAFQTITRLLAVFPRDEQEIIRIRLAESLHSVMSQRLLPKKEGKGRVVACEIMLVTGTIRECILDPSRTHEIPELIEEGRQHYGSQSFDQHLMDLVREGLVEFETARANANSPTDFDLKMNMFGSTSSGMGQGGGGVEQTGLADEMRNMMKGR
jgi:twitching motility protein PilT